jgi:hypothetical protein
METATRAAPSPTAAPRPEGRSRVRPFLLAIAGPALIVGSVLVALRGFAFLPNLTNQHPDILTFWLPRSCLLGDTLSSGRVPLWNPFEMAGTPFAADAQSGWLSLSWMSASSLLGCGDGLRALIVLHPILAGLGLWWFLRKEGLGRIAATAGGLSLAMAMAASSVAISMPFAGTLAWTPLVLVGASGFFSAAGWRRFGWLGIAAFGWSQVATSHLSHGLLICTAFVTVYVVARAIRERRSGSLTTRAAVLLGLGFLAFLPLASLAVLIPRLALLDRSSLRVGYGGLQGTTTRIAALAGEDRPIPDHGVWSGWPFAIASTPGAYVGALILLMIPFAFRDRARRHLVATLAVIGGGAYLLTLTLLVGTGWFRTAIQALPFGDVYLHNPGRLRYAAFLVVPALGAVGLQTLLDRRPSFGEAARWMAVSVGVFLALPLLLGAKPTRLVIFAIGVLLVVALAWALARGRRWAPAALGGILAVELLAGAIWSSAYEGGTVYLGLEGQDHPALLHGPLRWPDVDLDVYLEPGRLARTIAERDDGRYLAWVPPAAYFNKGYLFSQDEADWPALLLGRAILFGLHDALGYSPIQVPRYWNYIRATDRLPVFYNAAVITVPSPEDVRLLGVRFLIVHEGQELPDDLRGDEIATEGGYRLIELDVAQPRVSVVPSWTAVDDGSRALEMVLGRGFDPAETAVVEGRPRIEPVPGTQGGTATYVETAPEDVRLEVFADGPSIVVVRNTWERGWSATVDGQPAPLLRADFFLQGIPVGPGPHEVRLVYREPAIAWGLLGSALAWLGFGAAAAATVVAARRRAPARTPGPPPGV